MGQFLTPAPIAEFMASLFSVTSAPLRLLDAGAGYGALSCAVLDHRRTKRANDSVTAYELDTAVAEQLAESLSAYPAVTVEVRECDFLGSAAGLIRRGERPFNRAILNPPYKKIPSSGPARQNARDAGLETVNLYSAFVGLALELLEPQGELVAIIPRSFANGLYYKPFRQWILKRSAIRHIHLFDSRTSAFSDDAVLQENIIIVLERDGVQRDVTVTHSTDGTFSDLRQTSVPFSQIVNPSDRESYIRIPDGTPDPIADSAKIRCEIRELGCDVSTGPVVDFRAREHLCQEPEPGAVPLLYSQHFSGDRTTWPVAGKKPNAIRVHPETEKMLWPAGCYVVVRRFSSKEERRRIVASVVDPSVFQGCERVGFENHLNVFHSRKSPLSPEFAYGLAAYLNSEQLDDHLRRFSGHTQINATDLRNIPYPSADALVALGAWLIDNRKVEQAKWEEKIAELFSE